MTWQPPDLAALNARLGQQNRRLQGYLDGLVGQLDLLIDAALAHDWEAVRHWTREISQHGRVRNNAEILSSVQHVLDAANRANNEAELKRRVMKLISACGKSQP